MTPHYDIIIAGGGLAGLTAGLILSKSHSVLIIDPDDYPRHKMCGEYLSAEVYEFFKKEGLDLTQLTSYQFDELIFSTKKGHQLKTKLPLGGFGISRYALDLALYNKVKAHATFEIDRVLSILKTDDYFTVETSDKTFTCKQAIMATGKRSVLDKNLDRPFIAQKSPWLAVKMHYNYDMPANEVQLHNFEGGYAGLSKIENGNVNLCYLSTFESFKRFKNVDAFNENVLSENPHLKRFFKTAVPQWEQPITISQISFEQKKPVEDEIIMAGDTAGLIHPLCGNGMAMAIHSGLLAAQAISPFLRGTLNREEALKDYEKIWNVNFKARLRMGRYLQGILLHPVYTKVAMGFIKNIPIALPMIIKKTHGKPI
jgi:flavin-dependent dehydrogenase